MSRPSLSQLSPLFLRSSLSHGSSFSPFRRFLSSFIASADRSPISFLLSPTPHRSDLTGAVHLGKQVTGGSNLLQGASGPRSVHSTANGSVPNSLSFDSRRNFDTGRNSPMDFVKSVIEEDGKPFPQSNVNMGRDFNFGSPLPRPNVIRGRDVDIVHFKLMRNNTFITVTDRKGDTKLKASAGRLEELKGGPKLSRYAAEAVAEYVGRESRKLGLKSVVMRVKGFTYFKKKKQAIMSWKDGFTDSKTDKSPVVYIEDTTRRPHNGCRLPKRRRV